MSAREEILGRIRTAVGPDRSAVAPIARDYRTADDRPLAQLLDVLTDRLEDYKATVLRCGPSDVSSTVTTALRTARGVFISSCWTTAAPECSPTPRDAMRCGASAARRA